jgi:hypothetical protein
MRNPLGRAHYRRRTWRLERVLQSGRLRRGMAPS